MALLGNYMYAIHTRQRKSSLKFIQWLEATLSVDKFAIKGAIYLWRPHGGGSGSGGRVWTGVKPHLDVHTENQN